MRIISSFHDYYDSVMRHGMDRTCVYLREEVALEVPAFCRHSGQWPWRFHVQRIELIRFWVGFCGQLIPGVYSSTYAYQSDRFHYSLEHLLGYTQSLKMNLSKHSRKDFEERCSRAFEFPTGYGQSSRDEAARMRDYLDNLFLSHKVPVFMVSPFHGHSGFPIILNPKLGMVDFQKVKDPFSAFQEIHGYLSGVLGVTHMPIELPVPDEIKAASRGHGDKYSFRKPPGKRGAPPWR